MKRAIEYQANDGTRFATAVECKAHERESVFRCLANLTHEQVNAALNRTDVLVADAIEFAGKLISQKRRADGAMRRKKKTIAERPEGAAKIVAMQAKKTSK